MGQDTGFGKISNYDREEDRLNVEAEQDKPECDTGAIELQTKMELRTKALEELVHISEMIAFIRSPKEDETVEFISKGIEAFGYRAEDFTSGKVTFRDLIHPDDADRAFLELTENALEGASEHRQTYRVRTKKGNIRIVEERIAIRRDDNGKVIYYQGVLDDVTDK